MKLFCMHSLCVNLIIIAGIMSLNAKEVNLAANGNFESPITEKGFWKLNKGAVQVTDEFFKGKSAVKITRTTPEGNIRHSLLSDFMPYNDSPVKISAWWKGKNITPGKKSWHIALFHVYFFNKDKKRVGSHSAVSSLKGDSNWAQCKRTYYPTTAKKDRWHTIPDGTKYIQIEFLLLGCTGILWVDNVKVISKATPQAIPQETIKKVDLSKMTASEKAEYQRLLLATRKPKKDRSVKKSLNKLVFDDVKLSPSTPWRGKYPKIPKMKVENGNIYLNGKPSMLIGVETHFRLYPFMYKLLGLDFVVLAISDAGHTKLNKIDNRTYKVSWKNYKWLDTMLDSLAREGIWAYLDFWMGGIAVRKNFPEMIIQDPPQHFIWLRMTNQNVKRYINNFSKSIAQFSRNYPIMGYEFMNEIMYTSPYHPVNLKMFRQEMLKKYSTITKANKIWETSFKSFAEVVPPKKGGVSGMKLTLPKNFSQTLFCDYTKFSERLLAKHIFDWRKAFRKYEPNGMTFVQAINGMWMDYGNQGVNPELMIDSEDALGCEAGITFIPQPTGAESLKLIKNMVLRLMTRDVWRSVSPNKPLIDGESPLSVAMPPASKALLDIHGSWKFKSFAADKGINEKKKYFDAADNDPAKLWTKLNYNDSKWSDIKVPSMWGKAGFKKTYIGLYRKTFAMPNYNGPVYLSGKRLSDFAHVYINGHLVKKTKIWSEEFCADISKYVRPGKQNVIALRIYNKYFGGGMYWGGVRGSIELVKSSTKMVPLTPGQMRSYFWASAVHGYSATAITYFYSGEGTDYPFALFNPTYISIDAIKAVPVIKEEIKSVAEIVLPRPRIKGKVGLLYPFEAFRYHIHNDAVKMLQAPLSKDLLDYYQAVLFSQIPLDMVTSQQILDGKADKYQALIFRMAAMTKPGVIAKVKSFVEQGGIAIIDHGSLEKEDRFYKKVDASGLTGIKTKQTFSKNRKVLFNGLKFPVQKTVKRKSDNLSGISISNISAKVIAEYADGSPAITVKQQGKGRVYYIGCELPYEARKSLLNILLKKNNITADLKIAAKNGLGGFVEGHMFKRDKRQVWVLNNWGEKCEIKIAPTKLSDSKYRLREMVSGKQLKSPSGAKLWTKAQLLNGLSMKLPSQDPRILLLEDANVKALPRLTLSKKHQAVLDKSWERSPKAKTKILIDCKRSSIYSKVRTPSLTWLLENQGFQSINSVSRLGKDIKFTNKDITGSASLADFNILMLPGIPAIGGVRGYSSKELETIKNYVKNGGGLFLSGQFHRGPHGHMSSAYASKVAKLFGVKILRSAISDTSAHIMNETRFITCKDITKGELGSGVKVFQSMGMAPLKISGKGIETVVASSSKAVSAGYRNKNIPAIVALKYGKGRVIIAGDASWLQPQALIRDDNAQLALNILNWLAKRPIKVMNKSKLKKLIDTSLD